MSKNRKELSEELKGKIAKLFPSSIKSGFHAFLNELIKTKNHNDRIITVEDIVMQPKYDDFKFIRGEEFKIATNNKSFLDCGEWSVDYPYIDVDGTFIENNIVMKMRENGYGDIENLYRKTKGVVYILTCTIDDVEYIIKIGQTGKTMEERQSSYNCGNAVNRYNGTCSTTNFRIKQSLASGLVFNIHVLDCSTDNKVYTIGKYSSVEVAGGMPIGYEDILNQAFYDEFKQKPLLDIQTKK